MIERVLLRISPISFLADYNLGTTGNYTERRARGAKFVLQLS
jgi:hypothetical protein